LLKPQRSSDLLEPSFVGLMSFRLHTLAKTVDQHAEASHRQESGLGLQECRVIGVVGAYGSISFKVLCELAELEKSNGSRMVSRLIEQGFIERHEDPSDQRSFFVAPTPAGRKLRREIHRSAQERNDAWLSVLSTEQRAQFSTCLQLLQDQARSMSGSTSDPKAPKPTKEPFGADEPARLAWIDRGVAARLYDLLATALDKPGDLALDHRAAKKRSRKA
jgi:DNA-binding MarR family transcriptional regulator